MERLSLTLRGLKTTCFATGPAGGRPVVLLHGLGGNGRWWDLNARFLAEQGFHCFAPDLRGHGDTEQTRDGYSLDETVDDLLALAGALGLAAPDWIGHSWTGKVLIKLARRHPDRRGRVVLVDPSPIAGWGDDLAGAQAWTRRIYTAEFGPFASAAEARERLQGMAQYRNWEAALPGFEHGFIASPDGSLRAKVTLETVARVVDALHEDLTGLAAGLDALWLAIPERAEELTRPDRRVVTVEANHWIATDRPEAFHAALLPHLKQR